MLLLVGTQTASASQGCLYPLQNGSEVWVVQGDLFNLKGFLKDISDSKKHSIVNTANPVGYLGGGIAGLIKAKDQSGEVQKACTKFIEEYGSSEPFYKKVQGFCKIQYKKRFEKSIPVGSAFSTTSGSLKDDVGIEKIIHAVAPNCNKNGSKIEKDNYKYFLGQAYKNILAEAHQNGSKVVACPSLGAGIFECPLEKSAEQAAETVLSTMQTGSNQQILVLVLHSAKDFDAYHKAFTTQYQMMITK